MIRARYAVLWSAFNGTGTDDYGNAVESWAAPVSRNIYGVNFPTSSEPTEAGHNRVVVDAELLVPTNFASDERDRVTLHDGQLYEVVGTVGSAEGNPFGWNPGGRITLVRVQG